MTPPSRFSLYLPFVVGLCTGLLAILGLGATFNLHRAFDEDEQPSVAFLPTAVTQDRLGRYVVVGKARLVTNQANTGDIEASRFPVLVRPDESEVCLKLPSATPPDINVECPLSNSDVGHALLRMARAELAQQLAFRRRLERGRPNI